LGPVRVATKETVAPASLAARLDTLAMSVRDQWVAEELIARTWLALTGRLPWPVMTFLRDAHRRGLLRQSGGVYQFRHARLQDQLTR
jgi:hypothetical protein